MTCASFDFREQAGRIMVLQKRLAAERYAIHTRENRENFIALAIELYDVAKELAYQARKNLAGEFRTNAETFARTAMDYSDAVICDIIATPCLEDFCEELFCAKE